MCGVNSAINHILVLDSDCLRECSVFISVLSESGGGRGRAGGHGLTGSQGSDHGYWAGGGGKDSTGGYHETPPPSDNCRPASTHQI